MILHQLIENLFTKRMLRYVLDNIFSNITVLEILLATSHDTVYHILPNDLTSQ
jgi:hypothetical protein